ncbi:caspase family protein [Leptolyngbya sp. AN02str]|uniref:caspase family protein n=1 Tax=Leptolyngbya sp. AN02str TaxID=3423363 RepID=UPI003D320286
MTQTPTIYALLIGIDYYKPNRLYRNLKGAVRDINLVYTFLKDTLNVPDAHIHKLTSPNQDDTALLDARSAQDLVPTYDNIVHAFNSITAMAQPGDQIYIHYSGHGGRAVSIYPFKQEAYDESIVPMDIKESQYLRDVELTTLLKRMTDKGLIVTVVLDSCHSGGATRGDAQIRSSEYPDTEQRPSASLVAEPEELERTWLALTRDRVIGAAGLPQPRDYVLLAACRPNEFAYEYPVNGGTQRNGALTYWMIDTLTSVATSGQRLTYKLLHDRIHAQIQSKFTQQTPMILGESHRLVFGSDRWSTPFTVSVIKVISEEQITLNAGLAQGLSKGTRFSIYPLNTTDFTEKQNQVAIVELTKVVGSEATASVLKPEDGGIPVTRTLEPGAPAIMVSAPTQLIQRVRFTDEKVEGGQENELPPSLVNRQKEALEKVRQALGNNGWIVEEGEGETALYQVAIDREGNYEICKNRPIPNLQPSLSIDDPTAPKRVVERLVHLAKYQAVESLDNSNSKLASELEIEVLTEDEQPFPDPQNQTVKGGDIVRLRLINKGSQPLKIAVLDIEPTWEISQLEIGGIEAPFFQLEPGQIDVSLQFDELEDSIYGRSREIFKVFAIRNGLADFRWLTLPPLDEPPTPRKANLDEELRKTAEEIASRSGKSEEMNPLNSLLKLIGADLDDVPSHTRAKVIVDPNEDWGTKQVQVFIE